MKNFLKTEYKREQWRKPDSQLHYLKCKIWIFIHIVVVYMNHPKTGMKWGWGRGENSVWIASYHFPLPAVDQPYFFWNSQEVTVVSHFIGCPSMGRILEGTAFPGLVLQRTKMFRPDSPFCAIVKATGIPFGLGCFIPWHSALYDISFICH